MKKFPAKYIAQRVDFENSWWHTPDFEQNIRNFKKRSFFTLFYNKLINDSKKSVILYGAQRVGKTTLIIQSIIELINAGFRKKNLVYISLDNPIFYNYKLTEILEILFYQRSHSKTEPYIVFFDKIQFYAHWMDEIVQLTQQFANIRFVFVDSIAKNKIDELKSKEESFYFFKLPVLTFFEYINFMHSENWLECDESSENCNISILDQYFNDYIRFGGHTELLLAKKYHTESARILQNSLFNQFTLSSFPLLASPIENEQINAFIGYLMLNTGKLTSLDIIASDTDLSHEKINDLLDFLNNNYFISILRPFKEKNSTYFKVYISNTSSISAIFDLKNVIKSLDYNYLVETAILSQWEHVEKEFWYHEDKEFSISFISAADIEFIDWCTLVNYEGNSLKNRNEFVQFCDKEGIYFPIVTTKNEINAPEVNGLIISLQPSSLYCYQIGRHIIESQLIDD